MLMEFALSKKKQKSGVLTQLPILLNGEGQMRVWAT
jgi:hypothetical protein